MTAPLMALIAWWHRWRVLRALAGLTFRKGGL